MSKKRNQSEKPTVIEEELNTIFSAEFLEKTAKETGFIIRNPPVAGPQTCAGKSCAFFPGT